MIRTLFGWLTLSITLVLSGCTRTPVGGAREAAFEWFEYTGRDPVLEDAAGPGEYANPIMAGFYPDPSIVRVGEDYYMVHSTFAWFPGIPVFHSTDLVEWTQIGNVLDRPGQVDFDSIGVSRGVFAPTIRYHDGVFYVVSTLVDAGGNFVATATDPAGPWSDPTFLPEVDGIDPSLFFDSDGRAWMTNNGPPDGDPLYGGHRALWIQEFDPKALATTGPRTLIVDGGVDITTEPIWIEGPHIFRVDPYYYLIAAEGGTASWHSEVVFRSTDVLGPWVPYAGNPILTQRHLDPERPNPVTSTGHADMVMTPDGDWWAVFLGCRPYEDDLYNTGRETFLMPVDWTSGWPVVTRNDERVPYARARPDLTPAEPAPIPHSGNFTVRDEFESLHPYWVELRTPREKWHRTEDGRLLLRARADDLGGLGQPSFLARRQQHTHATASIRMRFDPVHADDRAGLAVFQNESAWYLLAIRQGRDGPEVVLERGSAGQVETLASHPLSRAPGEAVGLRIDADADRYAFRFALDADPWQTLADDVDGTILSTARAGGFVGAMFGLYAYAAQN